MCSFAFPKNRRSISVFYFPKKMILSDTDCKAPKFLECHPNYQYTFYQLKGRCLARLSVCISMDDQLNISLTPYEDFCYAILQFSKRCIG